MYGFSFLKSFDSRFQCFYFACLARPLHFISIALAETIDTAHATQGLVYEPPIFHLHVVLPGLYKNLTVWHLPENKHITEADICRRIARGDPAAFKHLFDTYYSAIFSFFRKRGLEHTLAEDLAQDVFVNVWKRREYLDPRQSMRGYLYAAAYNNMKMHFRSKAVRDTHMQSLTEAPESHISPANDEFDMSEHINKAIAALPDYQKVVFVMHRYDGLTYKEIAQVLDLSTKTIESRMSKALKALRITLKHLLLWLILIFS